MHESPSCLTVPAVGGGHDRPARVATTKWQGFLKYVTTLSHQLCDAVLPAPYRWRVISFRFSEKFKSHKFFHGTILLQNRPGYDIIIVNCQFSIVNSAKPFKHRFVSLPGFPGGRYSLVSGWTPVTEKITHSAMLVAWSPMRSKYLATMSKSRAYSPSPGFPAIKSRMSLLIRLK